MSSDGGGSAPILGGIFSAGGALMEASDKANAYEDQANTLNKNAAMERKIGAYNVMRQQIASGKKIGAIEANSAASGIASDSGTVLSTIQASVTNSEFDRLSILHGADMRASIMEERAKYDMSAADRSRQLGYFNAFGAVFGAGAKSASMAGPGGNDGNGSVREDYDGSGGGGYGTAGGSYGSGGYGSDWENA